MTRDLNGVAIPSRYVEELARGETNTLGVNFPKLLIRGKTYLARYKDVADMNQDSNNSHAKSLRESPVKAFVDWKIERKTRPANETLKEIPLPPTPTTIAPFHSSTSGGYNPGILDETRRRLDTYCASFINRLGSIALQKGNYGFPVPKNGQNVQK